MMKRQITQIFHSIIAKSAQKRDEVPEASLARHFAGESMDWGASGVLSDWKTFLKIVDSILEEDGAQGALLVAGLDRFKEVNAIYGRDTGDLVLQNAAGELRDVFGEKSFLCRLRGDLFALWIPELHPDQAEYVRRQVGIVNDRLLHAKGGLPPVSLSAGVAFCAGGDDCRKLDKKAVATMYKVKESGRCGCEVYEEHGCQT